MAKGTPWSERSGAQRRQTFGRFALAYVFIAIVALVLGWLPVGIVFGLGALGLGIGWYTTPLTEDTPKPEREKPDWMRAMDDPNAPDLTRPEYRTKPPSAATTAPEGTGENEPSTRTGSDAHDTNQSPFDRPGDDVASAAVNPPRDHPDAAPRPEPPPSPTN